MNTEKHNRVSVDTNILINDSSILFDTTKEFVISFQVLRELDKLTQPGFKEKCTDSY